MSPKDIDEFRMMEDLQDEIEATFDDEFPVAPDEDFRAANVEDPPDEPETDVDAVAEKDIEFLDARAAELDAVLSQPIEEDLDL